MMAIAKETTYAKEETTDRPIVSQVIVDVQGIKGDVDPWVDLVKKLIFIQEGEPFSTKRFQGSLEALKASKIFRAIHVSESEQGEERLILRFQVTPFPRVKDIKASLCWSEKFSTPCSSVLEIHTIRKRFPPRRLPLSGFSRKKGTLCRLLS